jgi:hypothetical protein
VFERLLYTDCRAGQGRGGGTGFQIQAQSRGVTPALSRLATENLLYASQQEWLTSGRAVEDFPLGLAHWAKDGLGTAQSRYLGQEVTGGRSGNHLADCLLTTDTELYGAIRPAQLLESEVWRDEAFDSIECPPFDGFLQPGPLTNDDIQKWLTEDANRPDVLKKLVSILADPGGPSVLILANTTEEAVRWIAAATILLPIRVALGLSFKVFVNNIHQASQRIIAVPKELNSTVRMDAAGSRFVLDATDSTCGAFETTPLAEFWVSLLLEAEDAYDVVEAVDLADVLAGNDPTLAAEAPETAWAVTAEGEMPANPGGLIRWLTRPKASNLEEYEVAVADRLIESGLADASTLLWMERQADVGKLGVDRSSLRRVLMSAEISAAPKAMNVRPEALTPIDVGEEARRDAESAISSALLVATDGSVIDRLLRTAKRHAVPLKLAPLQDRLRWFITDWIENPAERYDPGLWALSESLIEELASQLQSNREFAGSYKRVRPLLAQAWADLLPRVRDPNSRLARELNAASIAIANEKTKLRQLETIVKGLSEDDHFQELTAFEGTLMAWRALSGREAMQFVDTVVPPRAWPPGAFPAPELTDLLVATVLDGAGRPDRLILNTIWRLAEAHLLPINTETDELYRSDKRMGNLLSDAKAVRSVPDLQRLRSLEGVNPYVIRIRLPDFVYVSLGSPVRGLGATLLAGLDTTWQREFLVHWGKELHSNGSATAAARGYAWCIDEYFGLRGAMRDNVGNQIAQYVAGLPDPEQAAWIESVERLLRPDEREGFQDFISTQHRSLRHKLKPFLHGSSEGLSKRSKRDHDED